jgi:NO-binding membrane sensor protein with MHYT domain
MNESILPDHALFVWLLAGGVASLTTHLGLGWLARARRHPAFVDGVPSQLAAAAVMGTGLCATALINLLGEPLHFELGYGSLAAVVLWLGAMLASLAIVAGLTYSTRWWMLLPAAVVLAALLVGIQVGWVWAAGLRPGVLWRWPMVGVGIGMALIGTLVGLSMALKQGSRRRYDAQSLRRRGAALMLGLSLMGGQQVALSAADAGSQRFSAYRKQLPGTLVGVVCGVLVPMTLVVLSIDLSMRNRHRQRSLSQFAPERRRKRRHKVRVL